MTVPDVLEPQGAPGYDGIAKSLHWLAVALLGCQFVTAALLPDIKVDTAPDLVINLHFSFGFVILVVMALRIVRRLTHPVPVSPLDAPAWERFLARATHLTFYVVLLIGPFLGWASASAHSVPIRLFGLVAMPDIAPRKAHWAALAGDIHGYAMWTLLGLIAIHASAALYHHFVRHDQVLRRMLPTPAGE
jgi:cytochrome b561